MPNLVSLIPNLPQSPEIGQIYDFWVSDHNSRTSDDMGMKLGKVTKFSKGNKTTPKTFDDNVMSRH